MKFDFFSLDYIYYPVSGIMWVWHKLFGLALGNNNPWAWVLSVVFLVFTLRGLLFKPFMKQMNAQMKMQAVAPELKKLREKYKDDKTRLAEEMQKFNKEAGVNPLGGCLPALVQAPVFIGLFHVLRSFKPNWGQVYFFGRSDVQSFVDAKLFGGAPLSSFITQPWVSTAKQIGLGPDGLNGNRGTVIAISVPIIILASIATHLTSRRSIARQRQMQVDQSANPQSAIMNKVMLYVFPLGVLATGPFFPLAIIIYYLSNNTWTFGQLYVAHRIQDKKMAAESMVIDEAKEAAKFSKPLPGARPSTKPAPGTKPVPGARPSGARPAGPKPGVKPAPRAKPTAGRPMTPGGRPATSDRPVVRPKPTSGGRPASGTKRPVIQPSSKTPAGPDHVPNGSAGSGPSLEKGAKLNGTSSTGRVDMNGRGANGSTPYGAAANGAAANGSAANGAAAHGAAASPTGSNGTAAGADGTPVPAKKKKPGRR